MREPAVWLLVAAALAILGKWLPISVAKPTASQTAVVDERPMCPPECYCLSITQVLCNSGGLTRIPLEHFPRQVRSLSISRSDIQVIKADAFTGLKNLTALTLDECNITSIRAFAFRGLSRLKHLSVEHTPLEVISSFAFAGLHDIEMIKLSNNRIHTIEGEAFAGSSHINLLLLNQNPMRLLKAKAFSGLADVKHLIVPHGIAGIQADAFSGLDHVGVLKLAYMDLPSLDANTFRGLSHVHYLNIQHSDLGIIRKDAFMELSQVLNLNFHNNKIDMIEEFRVLPKNKVGNLRFIGNHVLENPEPGAITIHISGNMTVRNNAFPCDCGLRTLLASPLVNGSTNAFRANNTCIKPLGLNGRVMSTVNLEAVWSFQECQKSSPTGNGDSNHIPGVHPSSGQLESSCRRRRNDVIVVVLMILFVLNCWSS